MEVFKVGDTVTYNCNGVLYSCFVKRREYNLELVFYSNMSHRIEIFTGVPKSSPYLKHCDEREFHPKLKEAYQIVFKPLEKGTIVKFNIKKKYHIGQVIIPGSKPTVLYDKTKKIRAISTFFKRVTDCTADSLNAAGNIRWSVEQFIEYPDVSMHSKAFCSYISYKGKKVIVAKNTGDGDKIYFKDVKSDSTAYTDLFLKEMRNWATKHKFTYSESDMAEQWILWFVYNQKKFTFKKHYAMFKSGEGHGASFAKDKSEEEITIV